MGGLPPRTRCGDWLDSPGLLTAAARIGLRYGLGREEVLDLQQELRIALWQHGLDVPVPASWVFRVGIHKAVDLVRRRLRARAHDRLLAYTQERPVVDQELEYLLEVRVDHLPLRLRKFYDLHYRQGLSEREIAGRMGMCRASVRWLDRCCRRKILG